MPLCGENTILVVRESGGQTVVGKRLRRLYCRLLVQEVFGRPVHAMQRVEAFAQRIRGMWKFGGREIGQV